MKYVIASMKTCTPEGWQNITNIVQDVIPFVTGMTMNHGPNCVNIAVVIHEDTPDPIRDDVIEGLAMAFMPARYATLPDDEPGVDAGDWSYRL